MAKDFAVCQSGKISPNLVTLFKILLTVSSKKFETTIQPFSVIFVFFSSHYQIQVKFQFQKRNLKINGVLGIRTRKHRRNHGAMGPPKLQILPSQFYFCLFYLIEVVNVCSTRLT